MDFHDDMFRIERYSDLIKQVNSLEDPNIEKVKMLLEDHSDESYFDFFVKIDKHTFGCQLKILKRYCAFFNSYKIGQTAEIPAAKVSPIIFHTIYDWLVSNSTCNIFTGKNVLDLLQAAEYLQIPQLEGCCYKVIDGLKEENALQLLIEAHIKKEEINVEIMLPRIQTSFLPFVGSHEFDELPVDTVCTLLSSNFIAVHSEVEVFMSAIKWLMHDWEHRVDYVVRLMKCVRFGLMSATELIEICRSEELDEVTGISHVSRMLESGRAVIAVRCLYGHEKEDMFKRMRHLGLEDPQERNWIGEKRKYSSYNDVLQQLKSTQTKKKVSAAENENSKIVHQGMTQEELRDEGPLRLPTGRHIHLADRVEHLQNELSRLLYKIQQQKREIRLRTREFQLQIKRELQLALTSGNKRPFQGYLTLKAYYKILHLRRMQDLRSKGQNTAATVEEEEDSDIIRLSEQLKALEDMLQRSNEMMVNKGLPRLREQLIENNQSTDEVKRHLQVLLDRSRQGENSRELLFSVLENNLQTRDELNECGLVVKCEENTSEVFGIDHSKGDTFQEKRFHCQINEPVLKISLEHFKDPLITPEFRWQQLCNDTQNHLLNGELSLMDVNHELLPERKIIQDYLYENAAIQQSLSPERQLRLQDMEIHMNSLNQKLQNNSSSLFLRESSEHENDNRDSNEEITSQEQLQILSGSKQSQTTQQQNQQHPSLLQEYISSPEEFTPQDYTLLPQYGIFPSSSEEFNPFMQEELELIRINEACRQFDDWEMNQNADNRQDLLGLLMDEKGMKENLSFQKLVALENMEQYEPLPQWNNDISDATNDSSLDLNAKNTVKENNNCSLPEKSKLLDYEEARENVMFWKNNQNMRPQQVLFPEIAFREDVKRHSHEFNGTPPTSTVNQYDYPLVESNIYQELPGEITIIGNHRQPSPILRTDQFDENKYNISQRYEYFLNCPWVRYDEELNESLIIEDDTESEGKQNNLQKQENAEEGQTMKDMWIDNEQMSDTECLEDENIHSMDTNNSDKEKCSDSESEEQAGSSSQSATSNLDGSSAESNKESDDSELMTLKHELPFLRKRLARLEEKMNKIVALKPKKIKNKNIG